MLFRYFTLRCLFSLLVLPAPAQQLPAQRVGGKPSPQASRTALRLKIDSVLQTQKGQFALAFKDLSTGETLFIHEHESFHAASTMKTPVLIEVFRQADRGRLSLSDSLPLRNEFRSIADSSLFQLSAADDGDTTLYLHIGERRTIRELAYRMITLSSNFATNLLIDKVGAVNVQATLRELGANDIRVLRGVEDEKAFEKGWNNTVTAYDLLLLFEKMARRRLVSPAASDAMIRILLDQQFNEIIPARLPPSVKVAHKTGWFKGVNHDSGIVFLPDGRKYVLILLSRDVDDDKSATKALAYISELLYKYVNKYF